MSNSLIVHAREFTTIEVQGLSLWNALQDRGLADLAQRLLDATLMHEHYTSLLPHALVDRSPEQIQQQAVFRQVFDDLVQQAESALGAGTSP